MKKSTSLAKKTIREVAARAGVATGTASEALRGLGRIAPATRARVCAAAQELGYRPDPVLGMLAARRFSGRKRAEELRLEVVNVVAPGERSRAGAELAESLVALGYDYSEVVVADEAQLARRVVEWRKRRVRGLIVERYMPADWLVRARPEELSVVLLGGKTCLPGAHTVRLDIALTFEMAWARAMERGHRRVGVVLHRHDEPMVEDRILDAAVEAIRDRLAGDVTMSILREPLSAPRAEQAERLAAWARRTKPEIVIGNGISCELAAALPKPLPGLALKAADDCGVEGCAVPWASIARTAARLVDAMIRQGERGLPAVPQTTLVPPDWVPAAAGVAG